MWIPPTYCQQCKFIYLTFCLSVKGLIKVESNHGWEYNNVKTLEGELDNPHCHIWLKRLIFDVARRNSVYTKKGG